MRSVLFEMDLGRRYNLERRTTSEASTHTLAVGVAVDAVFVAYLLLPSISASAAESPVVAAVLPRLSTRCISDVDHLRLDHASRAHREAVAVFPGVSPERGWVGRGQVSVSCGNV
jgi:hypothetical protein